MGPQEKITTRTHEGKYRKSGYLSRSLILVKQTYWC